MKFFAVSANIFALVLLFLNVSVVAQKKETKTIIIPSGPPKISKPAPKSPSAYSLPSGTVVRVKMDSELSSKSASVDDTFTTTLMAPLILRDVEVLPANTVVEGRVVKAVKASRKGDPGRLKVIFQKLTLPDGTTREIEGELSSILERKVELDSEAQQVKGSSTVKENVGIIAGGAGIGAVIGGIASGADGALIGAAIGAGAGTGAAMARKGNEAIIKANSELSILLKSEVMLPAKDY